MVGAVSVPVTLKMRLGWDDDCLTAPDIARRAEVILSLGGKALVYGDRLMPPLLNRLLRSK